MREPLEDYLDPNLHLPLPELSWPDPAFPPCIYDPTAWKNNRDLRDAEGDNVTPSWFVECAAKELAPPLAEERTISAFKWLTNLDMMEGHSFLMFFAFSTPDFPSSDVSFFTCLYHPTLQPYGTCFSPSSSKSLR